MELYIHRSDYITIHIIKYDRLIHTIFSSSSSSIIKLIQINIYNNTNTNTNMNDNIQINQNIKSTIMDEENKTSANNHITARVFDFVDIHPSEIRHISFDQSSSTLSIARQHYSELIKLKIDSENSNIITEQLISFQPCQRIYLIECFIVLVMPFELKISRDGKWSHFPFTTQLISSSTRYNKKANKLYTFHVNQVAQWSISEEDGVRVKYLSKNQAPYHISQEGVLEGYGKKTKPNGYKETRFTVVEESENGQYLFVGTNHGHLYIYETKFLTHLKTFHRHQASILSIKSYKNVCYFTGSDSKISSIVFIQNETKGGSWTLSQETRGQSHDIYSIEHIHLQGGQSYLVSGGITTDLCFYTLQEQILSQKFVHKISYSSEKLVRMCSPYLVVNHFNSFQIWKIPRQDNRKENVQLLVKYEVTFYKNIRNIICKKCEDGIILFVYTQEEGVLWKFNQEDGLIKLLTVKNQYNLVEWYKNNSLLTIRDGNKLEIFNLKNGNIRQIADLEIQFPTDLKISLEGNRVLISSKFSLIVEVYKIVKQNSQRTICLSLKNLYNIIDFCYYNPKNLLIKYFDESTIEQIDKKGLLVSEVVKLPIQRVRDFGWVPFTLKQKNKLFWYAAGEHRLVLVTRMKLVSKNKKVRVKQMPRIGNVIINEEEDKQKDWNIGIVPLDFSKMISQKIMPIITKKIG